MNIEKEANTKVTTNENAEIKQTRFWQEKYDKVHAELRQSKIRTDKEW